MTNEQTVPKLLTSEQAAVLLGVTPHTLAVWRCEKRYPLAYVKCGRWVRYRAADVAEFIENNLQACA